MPVTTHDGGSMPAVVTLPESGRGPGLVVVQEIFGVTPYLLSRAQDLAALGYVTVVPDLFWRLGQNLVTDEQTEAGLYKRPSATSANSTSRRQSTTPIATLEHVRAMPETGGKAGILGFCLGGSIAYQVGVQSNPDVVVSYYGSTVADNLDNAAQLQCPVIFHFGGDDPYIPMEQVERDQGCVLAASLSRAAHVSRRRARVRQRPLADVPQRRGAGGLLATDNGLPAARLPGLGFLNHALGRGSVGAAHDQADHDPQRDAGSARSGPGRRPDRAPARRSGWPAARRACSQTDRSGSVSTPREASRRMVSSSHSRATKPTTPVSASASRYRLWACVLGVLSAMPE